MEQTDITEVTTSTEIIKKLDDTVVVCMNCGTECHGKFCPNCGQQTDTKRLTIASMLGNLVKAIMSNDGGVIFTLKNLFYRPSGMIVDYISGKRVNYFSPFPMIFLFLGLYILIFSFTGSKGDYFNTENEQSQETVQDSIGSKSGTKDPVQFNLKINDKEYSDTKEVVNFYKDAYDFYMSNYTLITLALIPIYIVFIRLFYGKRFRKKYNWGETCVVYVYTLVQITILDCIASLMFLISEEASDTMSDFVILMNVGFLAWNIHKLSNYSMAKNIWRSVLVNIMAFIVIIIIICVLIIYPIVKMQMEE